MRFIGKQKADPTGSWVIHPMEPPSYKDGSAQYGVTYTYKGTSLYEGVSSGKLHSSFPGKSLLKAALAVPMVSAKYPAACIIM